MISKVNEATSQIVKILNRNSVYKNNRQGVRSLMLEVRMMEDAALEQLEIINDMIKDIQGQCQHKKVKIAEDWDSYGYSGFYILECNDCGCIIDRLDNIYDIDDETIKHYGLKL